MNFRAGTIGLVGLPNAGKSTLINAIVGEKVAIVSSKAQTTRQRVIGIATSEETQLVFVDAPGFIRAENGLNRFLQQEAEDVCQQVDALLLILALDTDREEQVDQLLEAVSSFGKPWACVISKSDLEMVHRIPKIEAKIRERGVKSWTLSAQRNENEVRELLQKELAELVPPAEELVYDRDDYTTQTLREMAAELIRERCFEALQHEIPYHLAVKISKFDESSPSMTKIYAELVLGKESHKPIVIGQGGKRLKFIGSSARQKMESLLRTKVYLDLHVSVRPKWMKNPSFMKELGYAVNQ